MFLPFPALLDDTGERINIRLKTSGGVMVVDKNGKETKLEEYQFFDVVNGFLMSHIAKVSSRMRTERDKDFTLADPRYLPSQVNMLVPIEDPMRNVDDEEEQAGEDDLEENPELPMTFAKAVYLDKEKLVEKNKSIMIELQRSSIAHRSKLSSGGKRKSALTPTAAECIRKQADVQHMPTFGSAPSPKKVANRQSRTPSSASKNAEGVRFLALQAKKSIYFVHLLMLFFRIKEAQAGPQSGAHRPRLARSCLLNRQELAERRAQL